MTHDPTLVSSIGQISDQLTSGACDGEIFRLKMLDHDWEQFDFERHDRLQCG